MAIAAYSLPPHHPSELCLHMKSWSFMNLVMPLKMSDANLLPVLLILPLITLLKRVENKKKKGKGVETKQN